MEKGLWPKGVRTVPGSWPAPVASAGMAPAGRFLVSLGLWKVAAGCQSAGLLPRDWLNGSTGFMPWSPARREHSILEAT